jgi:hypothetical protein
MGINISMYRVIDSERARESDQFDWLRHSGDNEFMSWLVRHSVVRRSEVVDGGEDYHRPADFDAARVWVQENIVEDNQPRLLDALALMEADASLWFNASY